MALGALVVLSCSLAAGAAMAHPTPHLTDTHGAQAVGRLELPAVDLPAGALLWAGLWLIAGIGLLHVGVCRSPRRVIALGLSLVLAIFTHEAAVHSVHHLASPETAAACPVFSGSQHLSWGETQAVATDAPPPCVAPAPPLGAKAAPPSLMYRPHQGRAPPA